MKKHLPLLSFLFLLVVGCGSDAPKDDSTLRSELSKKEIDYGQTPPAQRARILALMRANNASAKADELERQWGMKK